MRALSSWLLLAALPAVLAVKTEDFKTCSQAAFCRRGRALSERASQTPNWKSPYAVDPASLAISQDQASFTAAVKSALYPEIKFGLDVRVHDDGVVRVRMDEVDGLRKRYDEAASWALIAEPKISKGVKWTVGKSNIKASYKTGSKKDEVEVVVEFNPLKVTLYRKGKEQVVLNGLGLLHMEHFRVKHVPKPEEVPEAGVDSEGDQIVMQVQPEGNPRAWFEGETEDGYWEETFRSWTDSKPKGKCLYAETCNVVLICRNVDRPRIPFLGYQLPQPRSCLRYPSTRNPSIPPNHFRRECVLYRSVSSLEFRRL